MKSFNQLLFVLILSVVLFPACDPEEPALINGEEIITTLTYTLTPSGGGDVVTLTFQDLDGDGGNDPTVTSGILMENTTYTGTLVLLNETETPAEDITVEVQEEAEEHQFFFATNLDGTSIDYDDLDANNQPIGINTTLTTTTTENGTITISLRHQPNKSATGVVGGDITNAGGETDIEVIFNVDVQ